MSEGRRFSVDRGVQNLHVKPLRPHCRLLCGGQIRPTLGKIDGALGVDHAEPILMVEGVILLGRDRMHGRSFVPSGVSGIVFLSGCGENQLDVPPREIGVHFPSQRRCPCDDWRGGGSAAEVVVVTIGILGRQNAPNSAKAARTVV